LPPNIGFQVSKTPLSLDALGFGRQENKISAVLKKSGWSVGWAYWKVF
jgi:hypothetical protein